MRSQNTKAFRVRHTGHFSLGQGKGNESHKVTLANFGRESEYQSV